jgi:hypothetical protein
MLTATQTRDTKTFYRGSTAPVTSVAIGGHGGAAVFAGCWDKDIWSWDRESRAVGRRYKGHSDFVKVIICARIEGKDVGHHLESTRTHPLKFFSASYLAEQIPKSSCGIPQRESACIPSATRLIP